MFHIELGGAIEGSGAQPNKSLARLYYKGPTQISFSNSLCFPSLTADFPCANLRDL